MLKTEVTVSQYASCVDAGACREPSADNDSYNNWGQPGRENYPINAVDWFQAREFAEWLGARLPTEAQWERAARSGARDTIYPWGDEEATCERALISDGTRCSAYGTTETCDKPLGNTAQGLCDMAGNVWEWVEDDFHFDYNGAPSDGSAWVDSPRANYRVWRGGSWNHYPTACRSAARGWNLPTYRYAEGGFRVATDLE